MSDAAPQNSASRWAGLVFISLAVSLIIVDSTIVNVAVPQIVDELSLSSTQVQWVQEAYTLVFASLLLAFGSLADRVGRRRMLVVGTVIFTVSSLFAALAPSGELLIAARVLQGVGGAMMLPTTLALINATFHGRERGLAFAVWGSTIGGMAAVGPLLGGWLTTAYSWRLAFGINIPLGILIAIGVLVTVSESKDPDARRVDVIAAVLSVITFGSLVFALIEGRTLGWWRTDKPFTIGQWTWPWDLSPVPIAFLISAIAGAAFIARGVRRQKAGKSTMLAFNLFRIPSFRNGNLVAMVVSLGEFGIILALPLWLQFVLGFEAVQTGLILLALAGGSFAASALTAPLSGRIAPLTLVRSGLVAEIVGIVGLAVMIHPGANWVTLLPGLFVYGLGVGLATAQLTGVVLTDVPVSQSGQGSGTQSTARQVGSALGIAILGTILFSVTGGILAADLADKGLPSAQADRVVSAVVDSAGAAIPGLRESPATAPLAAAAEDAFSTGTRLAAFSAAGFLTLGLLASGSLRTRRPQVSERDDGDLAPASEDAPVTD
jgi:EmrB/QacA subfamily drug resistance transporter